MGDYGSALDNRHRLLIVEIHSNEVQTILCDSSWIRVAWANLALGDMANEGEDSEGYQLHVGLARCQ
jgi:hypothetical protein